MKPHLIWFTLACAALALTSFASPKRPWEWTDDERIASRFAAQDIEQRTNAYKASHPKTTLDARTSGVGVRYVIDGRRNPELFMRHELFEDLLRGLGSNQAASERYRTSLDGELRAAGFTPATFWPELEKASRRYLDLQAQVDTPSHGRVRSDDDQLCAERAAALNQARRRLGADRFDAFLYSAIAPFMVHSQSTTFPDAADRLRREAGGCK